MRGSIIGRGRTQVFTFMEEHRDVSDMGQQADYADVRNRQAILEGVNAGKRIIFLCYTLAASMERQLDFVTAAVLKRYERQELQSTIYSCLKEIVVNATRANARFVYFQEKGLDESNPEEYKQGQAMLKQELSESWIQEYGGKARNRGLKVQVAFEHEASGLRLWVYNDTDMLPADEKRVRERLREGMSYDDLVSFYMTNADEGEGAGMGLVMNLLLLKGEKINPALFRVGVIDGKTMARIEIPFHDGFESVRGQNPYGLEARSDDIRLIYD